MIDEQLIIVECDDRLKRRGFEILKRVFGWYSIYAISAVEGGFSKMALAKLGDKDVGVIVFHKLRGNGVWLCVLYYVAVLREYRRRGVGKALIATGEELCGSVDIYVATTKLVNKVANRLFLSLGYVGYTWEELERLIGIDAVEALLKATCGYEDDVLYAKSYKNEDPLRLLALVREGNDVYRFWRDACYGTWLRARGL